MITTSKLDRGWPLKGKTTAFTPLIVSGWFFAVNVLYIFKIGNLVFQYFYVDALCRSLFFLIKFSVFVVNGLETFMIRIFAEVLFLVWVHT